jgi:hypothetical protein
VVVPRTPLVLLGDREAPRPARAAQAQARTGGRALEAHPLQPQRVEAVRPSEAARAQVRPGDRQLRDLRVAQRLDAGLEA